MKTTKNNMTKLQAIETAAWTWVNDGGSWARKRDSKKLANLRLNWEKEVEKLGGVDYNFSDCLA
tara:strand:- start:615 stop:806 length:192 start_codon:yes stop_codon:yes gene_type:complete